ncbi:hypothetical protein [Pseudomonas sp.]|uniref:hypothetical protein n=1 Tax=Pseudomonas sp. TaxID=306 RepID=UPI00299D9B69|nr:hypothetical protein [Pseudomonas sp.]MDX1370345.1 hypothetical protein [Pseudomonas sp.]MDX1724061.1 hypothetical protein [Pseudomonas sp.]
MLFTALSLLASHSLAGVEIRQSYWYVQLACEGYSQCFASSNGSYTSSQNAARRFDDQGKAQRFVDSFTSSIRDKSPLIVQGFDSKCVSDAEARRLQLSGNPCLP